MTNAPRTFTPFQIWLETQLANSLTLTHVAGEIGMSVAQLSKIRRGHHGYPRTRLETGVAITGLTVAQLLQRATDPNEPAPAPIEAVAPPQPIEFSVTPERVHVALQHGLVFGPERAAFCRSIIVGDPDEAWRLWCAQREGEKSGTTPTLQAAQAPYEPQLYDHLKPNPDRPDYRADAETLAVGATPNSSYSVKIGKR